MALSRQAKATLSRSDIVRWHLARMARKADPANGHFTKLAELIEVHPTTLSDWGSQGFIPFFQCKKLHKRFGKLAPIDDLCPAEYRAR
jgi:hypothetical protein